MLWDEGIFFLFLIEIGRFLNIREAKALRGGGETEDLKKVPPGLKKGS